MQTTAQDLISRMSPITLASLIADLENYGNLDSNEREWLDFSRDALTVNVGPTEARRMVAEAGKSAETK